MKKLALLLAVGLCSCGFHLEDQGSNQPDGGACPAAAPDAGSAALAGPRAFAVASAQESVSAWQPNAPDGGARQVPRLEIWLYQNAQVCGAGAVLPDGGTTREVTLGSLLALVLQSADGQYPPGTYRVVDGGYGVDGGTASGLLIDQLADGGSVLLGTTSGTVELDSISSCALAGQLDLALGFLDGGPDSTLSGTFSSAYCPASI